MEYQIRVYDPKTDEGLVRSILLSAYIDDSIDRPRTYDPKDKRQGANLAWDKVFARPKTEVLVACHPSYPTEIFGFAVQELVENEYHLHAVWVKHEFRHQGIGKLLTANCVSYSIRSKHTKTWDIIEGLKYRPYFLYFQPEELLKRRV